MKVFFLVGFFLSLWVGARGQTSEALKRLVQAECLKHAAIGVSVKQVADGKQVAGWNEGMALAPASVTKLLSTAFALSGKGIDYRFKTRIYHSGVIREGILLGNIIVKTDGDPCLESSYFKNHKLIAPLVEALRKAGIREIKGGIRIECAENTEETIPGTWVWEDISNYYGAAYHPFNYRDNLYTLELQSGVAGTKTKIVNIVPELPGITIRNEVRASERKGDNAWIYGGPYSPVLYVRGSIPQNRSSFKVKGAIPDPARCFAHELSGELTKAGISVRNEKCENSPTVELFALESPTLEEIVFHTNKSSVNLFAEALGKLAVGEKNIQDGMAAMFQTAGLDGGGVTLKDACGLSPMNAVPARVFTDLLVWAQRELGQPFVCSLPVAGIDGGLGGYYGGNTLLKNNLKAKTGSFSGARCLSGYVTSRSGKLLAFTILINNYTCATADLQRTVGLFLNELAKS